MLISQINPLFYHASVFAHRQIRTIYKLIRFNNYSRKKSNNILKYKLKSHKTVLLRKLGNADMQLQRNKIVNLELAIDKVSGIMIHPKETFSLWSLIGKPTYKKGYKDGIVLIFDKFEPGVGGGLCQLANLLYWIALHSPLEVTERHRHGYDVFPDSGRIIPFGTGATIFYNYVDLQFYNPTDQIFQLNLIIDNKNLRGELRSNKEVFLSYKIEEKDHQFIYDNKSKHYFRTNKIYRKIIDKHTGNLLERELICENYCKVAYEPINTNIIYNIN